MSEIEISSPPVELGENPYEQQDPHADTNQKKVLMADVAVSAVASGSEEAEAIVNEADKMSAEELRTKATTNYQQEQSSLLEAAIETTAIEDPDNLEPLVKASPVRFNEIEQMGSSKMAAHLNWATSLPGSENKTQEELKNVAADGMLLEAVGQMLDKRSWWQHGWDLLGAMAMPDESYNAAVVEGDLLLDKVGLTDYLGSGDALSNISDFRMSLSPEERVMFDEHLIKVVQDVDDNVLQQAGILMDILEGGDSAAFWQGFEKATIVLGGANIGKRFFQNLKALNVMRRTANAGDANTANKIADLVSRDVEVAKEVGVNQMDASVVGNPVRPDNVFTGAPEGLQREYRMYAQHTNDELAKASDVLSIQATPDTQDAEEIVAAVRRRLSKRDDIDNLDVSLGVEGVKIKYDIIDGDNLVSASEYRVFELDDLGGLKQKEANLIGSVFRVLTSPNTLLGIDRNFWVQQAEAALYAKGRVGKAYTSAVDAALKPINGNKKSMANVDKMMKQLDGTDIDTTYQKLVNEGVGGTRLTDNEFVAVVGLRKVLDDAWHTNNQTIRREKELRGEKYLDLGDDAAYVKPYDDANSAYTAFSTDAENIYIVDKNGVALEGLGLDNLKQAYSEGKRLVKNTGDELSWFNSDKGFVKYSLVDASDVKELPEFVLNRVKNYLPKLREDGNFFIKEQRKVNINGKEVNREVTKAYAATEAQGLRYIDKVRKAKKDAGEEFVEGSLSVRFDGEMSAAVRAGDSIAARGGLIRGKRKSTELDWAGDLDEGGRTDTLDSLQRYMAITADRAVMSEWRLSARHRVIQAAADTPLIGDKALKEDWAGLRGTIASAKLPPGRKAKLLSMYDQTDTMSMVPTASDQAFQGIVRAVGLKFDRAGKEGVAKFLYKVQDKSPVDLMKSMTFNLTLGAMNWVQIPVQMMGATVAISLNPVAAMKASPRWLIASSLDFATNEKTARELLTKLSGDIGVDAKTMASDYAAWRRSGMYESVVRGSADAASIANRLPYDANFLRKGFDKAVEVGQIPYKMGELGNMRISFFTALEREKALQGDAFKYSDATLAKVVARAEQYRLNMSGANKAAFQKGFWALPTQFKQIYTKYLEAITGSHFTWGSKDKFFLDGDKTRLLFGQATLFGAAGIPFFNYVVDQGLDMFGVDPEALGSEGLTLAKRGVMGWAINHELGIDALFSGRLTVNADMIEEVHKSFFDTKTPMLATMLGSSYLTGDKILDFISNFTMAGGMIVDDMLDGRDLTPVMQEAAIIMARSTAGLASSSRKWMAAYDLTDGWVRKTDGMPLYQTDPKLGDIVARYVGFGSQEMSDLYQLQQADYKRKDKIRDYVNRWTSITHDLDMAIKDQSEFQTEAAQRAATMVATQIDRLHPEDAAAVWQGIRSKLKNPRDFKEKVLRDSVLNALGETTTAANKMSIEKQKFIEEIESGE